MNRVICLIDGFNLYHAIDNLNHFPRTETSQINLNALKWVNLKKLAERYIRPQKQSLGRVLYFSAFATWRPDSYKRHREYIRALQAFGVEPVMGNFKAKTKRCPKCKNEYVTHEEKETDVNIALSILDLARQNAFDHLFLISADSDLAPAIRLLKKNNPEKLIWILTPPKLIMSKELLSAAGGGQFSREIKKSHIEESLLPEEILDVGGNIVAKRPTEYAP